MDSLPGIEQLATVKALTARLSVEPATIYAAIDAGQLTYHRIGKTRRVASSDAVEYVASRRIGRPAETNRL